MLVLIVSAAWLIHYPDIIKAPFRLTSVDAPKAVYTRTEGKLIRLFVHDNTTVRKGALLAYLESTADHDEVLQLANHLDSLSAWINTGRAGRLRHLLLPDYNHLGELQSAYQPFNLAYAELLSFLSDGFYLAKKRILQQESADLARLESNLHEQQVIGQRDFALAQQDFEAQRQLATEKVIAPLEFKREESKLLAKQMPLKQLESTTINNHAAQSAKLKELLELDKLIAEQRSKFLQSLNTGDKWY